MRPPVPERDPAARQPSRPDDPELEGAFLELADLDPADREVRLSAMPPDRRAAIESMLADLEAGAWLEEPLLGPAASLAGAFEQEPEQAGSVAVLPVWIGPYRVRRVLGRGGHAVVYLALQTGELRRWVALKVLLDDRRDGGALARFELERQTLATLEHRGVPRIFDSGRDEQGRPYFAMELVRGDWITRWCRDRDLPRRERIELFREALDAIRSAHAAGTVHRDLKPANIMVGETGGRPQVKVIDFGIARGGQVSAERLAATDPPGLLGSLSTMSPEQVRGGAEAATGRSDTFALGAILFELLADRPPRSLRDRALGEVVRDIAEREPPRLVSAVPECRGDLDAIVGKAMAFDPRDRYASIADFDADLERWLAGEPVAARVPGPFELGLRWLRRHRRPAAVAMILLALLAALGSIERSRSVRITTMREAGRLLSLLEEEHRLRRERGAEAERLRLLDEVLAATEESSGTPFEPAERAAIRARALIAECEPDLRGEYGGASEAKLAEAVALRRIEVAARPSDPSALEGLSLALVRLGDSDPRKGDLALNLYREALAIDERLHREHPRIRRFHDNLVWSHDRIGLSCWNLGRSEESQDAYSKLADEAMRLVAAHPEPAISRFTAAHAFKIGACARAVDGDLGGCVELLRRAAGEIDEAIRRDPQRAFFHVIRDDIFMTMAAIEVARGHLDEAIVAGDRSEESSRLARLLWPDHRAHDLVWAVEARLRRAVDAFDRGSVDEANRLIEEARTLRPSDPVPPSRNGRFPGPDRIAELAGDRGPLDELLTQVAAGRVEMDPPAHAVLVLRDVLAHAEWLDRRDPERAMACRTAARSLVAQAEAAAPGHPAVDEMRARLAIFEGRPDEAVSMLDRAIDGRGELVNAVVLAERGAVRAVARARIAPERIHGP